jgi:hypothetical protein
MFMTGAKWSDLNIHFIEDKRRKETNYDYKRANCSGGHGIK